MNDLSRIKNKKHVIYDFDGTIAKIIIDWTGWHVGVKKIYQKYEPSFSVDGFMHSYINEMIGKYGQKVRDEICEFNKNYEFENCTGLVLNHELISYIKNSPKQQHHILTSQNHRLLDKLLVDIDMTNNFTKIITRDDVFLIKPDPQGINMITNSDSVYDYIFLGDSTSDEQTAQAVGMDFEWIKI